MHPAMFQMKFEDWFNDEVSRTLTARQIFFIAPYTRVFLSPNMAAELLPRFVHTIYG